MISNEETKCTVSFQTKLSTFQKGEKPCYSANVIHNGTLYTDELVENTASESGVRTETVEYIAKLLLSQMKDALGNGRRLELGSIGGGLSLTGGFPSRDAAFDKARNTLVPKLHVKGDLATCTEGIECVNVTKGATVVVRSVVDTVHKTESELATGYNVVIYVSGTGLITSTDPESGEGCWLENYDTGVVASVGTVTGSTSTTLNATFAEMPEPGTYWFVVASRGGLGEEYGVVQAKRKVTVVTVNN